jgi:hypothetical protein
MAGRGEGIPERNDAKVTEELFGVIANNGKFYKRRFCDITVVLSIA